MLSVHLPFGTNSNVYRVELVKESGFPIIFSLLVSPVLFFQQTTEMYTRLTITDQLHIFKDLSFLGI